MRLDHTIPHDDFSPSHSVGYLASLPLLIPLESRRRSFSSTRFLPFRSNRRFNIPRVFILFEPDVLPVRKQTLTWDLSLRLRLWVSGVL